jgi:hypothetical protein
MAGESPFGLSFGDPRKYMGQSGLGQVGQALKTFALISGLEKSGAIKALDNIGIKPDNKGGFTFNRNPAGSVPPTAPSATETNMFNSGMNPAVPPENQQMMPVMPVAPVSPMGVQVTPFGQEAPSNVQINTFSPPPPDAGRQVLDNMYKPQSAVDVKNETDFNPLAPDTSNQMAVSPDAYKNTPGYGSTQEKAGKLMKLMGMG